MNFRQESDVNFEDEDKNTIETALKNSNNKVVFAFFGKLKFKTDYLEETDSAAVVGFVVIKIKSSWFDKKNKLIISVNINKKLTLNSVFFIVTNFQFVKKYASLQRL